MVDDDLLEFLVRVADNPAEWNKIRRVLSMLGREETGTVTAVRADGGNHVGAAAVSTASTSIPMPQITTPSPAPAKITTTVADLGNERGPKHQPPPPPTTTKTLWPSSDWILKRVQDIKAAAKARGIGAGGEDYDGDDDSNDYDYNDQTDDEIEEIEAPTAEPPLQPSRPPLLRTVSGHMSRYEFKRLDGRPNDGRVNGTYVAVIESDRPPRVVIYDSARQKKPRTEK
ncbi:PREDICTED: syndecan-like [Diuraphis noxia]|uniref:syndecan-like n=1 Tax=Diuraphis noxia TaxID=143948 RepID=UPI0007639F52|nr:PREDICTED: syndecan-like [Diuraphis noxia]